MVIVLSKQQAHIAMMNYISKTNNKKIGNKGNYFRRRPKSVKP